jgi:formate C-acetyltransferase
LKAVELALNGGKDLNVFTDPITGKKEKIKQDGPGTGDATEFKTWEEFKDAYIRQTRYIIEKCVNLYEVSESIRAKYIPTPYLSCLIKGCAEKGTDVTGGGAEIGFTTIEAVTYATTVDSLLAIKYLVFDKKVATMNELLMALKSNWNGFEILQTRAKNRAPKYGRDDDEADKMGQFVMELWTSETWKYKTTSTHRRFRPGMLSWNYWVGDGFVLAASADGRAKGQFLSNAICPSNGTDINGPTSNTNSVGKVLGGRTEKGDWKDFVNLLPNGASHTITFNPSFLKDEEHREKFKSFLKGYLENGGTALQINILDPDMLKDAQKNPRNYRHLLVRVTGYNAYFTSIGRELQDEIIARISHEKL